jgi:hypothetical protein
MRPKHLDGSPFISFQPEYCTGQKIENISDSGGKPDNLRIRRWRPWHFACAPTFVVGMGNRVVTRPFEPGTPFDFLLCYFPMREALTSS